IAVIDRVGDGRRLEPAEQRTLAAAYGETHRRLLAALDLAGRALPGRAPALLTSPSVATDEHGALYLRSSHIRLIDLARTLEEIGRLFATADARALAVGIAYG